MVNKNNVYVVYTKNEIPSKIIVNRTFYDKYKALSYLENKINSQCSEFILANGNENTNNWVAKVVEDTNDKYAVAFYYNEILQYTIYIMMMEVE